MLDKIKIKIIGKNIWRVGGKEYIKANRFKMYPACLLLLAER